jgi:hypothetical protein
VSSRELRLWLQINRYWPQAGKVRLLWRGGSAFPDLGRGGWAEQLLQGHAVFACEPATLSACFSVFVDTCPNERSNHANGERGQYIYVGVR